MKYTCTVEINAPIETVVSLWEDEQYFKEWQDDFKSIEQLEGIPNTKGAKAKIVFESLPSTRLGRRNYIELIETILVINLPKEKKGLYEHKHMTNTQSSRFESIGNNKTRYTSEVEYIQFNGFMIKGIAKLFPGKFKAQSQKWMDQFKEFVERDSRIS